MKPRQKIFSISAIFGVITLVLIWIFVYPLLKEIKKNSEELILVKQDLIFFRAKIKNLEQFKETYKSLEPDLKKFDELFIDPEVPIDFIRFLEKTAADSGILIDLSLIPIAQSKDDPWPPIGFQINLTGSFPNSLKFLEKIETAPYLIEIQSLNIKRLKDQERRAQQQIVLISDVSSTLLIKVFTK